MSGRPEALWGRGRRWIWLLFCLARHLYHVWRAGQLRFRLETFGLYYPALPYQRPWWKMSPRVALLFARQLPSYARWLVEMEDLRRGGPQGWWARRVKDEGGAHDRQAAADDADHAPIL